MQRRVTLFRTKGAASAWPHILKPWITASGPQALSSRRMVITPSLSFTRYIKRRLLADSTGSIGVEFLTHTQAWERLHARLCPELRVADRNTLHLLLAAAAEKHMTSPAAASVARDPSALMRTMDQAYTAGWSFKELNLPGLDPVHDTFTSYLRAAGVSTSQQIEKTVSRLAPGSEACLADELLIAGFDGSHWPLWNILTAAAQACSDTTVCLFDPRPSAEDTDGLWIDSWEDRFGAANEIQVHEDKPYSRLVEAMSIGQQLKEEAPVPDIMAGQSLESHAIALACRALQAAEQKGGSNVAVLFPGDSPLARETSRILSLLKVPHDDTIAHHTPVTPAESAWRAWLLFEQSRSAGSLLSFLSLSGCCRELFSMSLDELTDKLGRARDELILDRADLLLNQLHMNQLNGLCLPDNASFAVFTETTLKITGSIRIFSEAHLGEAVRHAASALSGSWNEPFSRDTYLAWLGSITAFMNRCTDPLSSHPYSRIHLAAYHRAEWQDWDHVIFSSLNADSWPPPHNPSPYLDGDTVRKLNAAALKQGRHGSGTRVIKPGCSLILGPTERSALSRAQFLNMLNSAGSATLSLSRTYHDRPSRLWAPGDFAAILFAAAYGKGLSDADISAIAHNTEQWISNTASRLRLHDTAIGSPEQTAAAFADRNNPDTPFGEYMFALKTPPPGILPLSCSAAPSMINTPELIWMHNFLGVEAGTWHASDLPWKKAAGIWIHRWLRSAITEDRSGRLCAKPDRAAIIRRLLQAADQTAAKAASVFTSCLGSVPGWWSALHLQARAVALSIVDDLDPVISGPGFNSIAVEWPLPEGTSIRLDDTSALLLKGRVDLLLCSGQPGSSPFNPSTQCLVIDHKTGGRLKLTAARLRDGEGIQILLYALALEQAGAGQADFAVSGPGGDAEERHTTAEFTSDPEVFSTLKTLAFQQATGVSGMAGDLDSEYGAVATYPVAMTAVPQPVLEAKFEKTFFIRKPSGTEP